MHNAPIVSMKVLFSWTIIISLALGMAIGHALSDLESANTQMGVSQCEDIAHDTNNIQH